MRSAVRRTTVVFAFALAVSTAGPANAAPTAVTFQCRGSAAGQTADFAMGQDVDSSAPSTVAAGAAFDVVIDPAPNTLPATASGYPVNSVRDVVLVMPVPGNASYTSAELTGGSGLHSTPSVSRDGDTISIAIPGPIPGGSDFELPTIIVRLTAGSSGTITSSLYGSGYSDPGLTFTASVTALFTVDAAVACHPEPNPTLTTTTIG